MAYFTIILAYLIGSVSLLAWMGFLFLGSPELVNLGLNETAIYGFNTCLCLVFFIQHSTMIRKSIRKWLAIFFPAEYLGAIYTLSSSAVLMVQMVFWQKSAYRVFTFQGVFYGMMHAIFFLSIIGFISGVRALDSFDAFGVESILRYLRSETPKTKIHFTTHGPYRWVRHPLYFFCLMFIWSCPTLTGDRLLFNLLWTGWIIVAAILEERDLVFDFGDVYRNYQQRVPMLIPWRILPDSS